MRNLKKFLALVLAFVMAMSLMTTVNASSFKDDDKITGAYQEAIDVLTELGVVNGYAEDDTFRPDAPITRGEVAAILYRIVTSDVKGDNLHLYENYTEFSDVPATGVWYTPYINYCYNNGLIQGVGGGKFEPKENVTGYQALVMILRAIGYSNENEFTNSDWKLKASGYGSRLDITTNIPTGSLGRYATREMVAEIMFKGMLAPTVSYSQLLNYTTNVLVAAGTKGSNGEVAYPDAVPETLMYRTFKIIGKSPVIGTDEFGRPSVVWLKDAKNDTVANGGKYIINATATVEIAADPDNGVKDGDKVEVDGAAHPGTAYPPASTPGADYGHFDTDAWKYSKDDSDTAAFSIPVAYQAKYDNVVTECDLATEVNNNKGFTANYVYLNGKRIMDHTDSTKTWSKKIDELHTVNAFINSQGRTLEVYKWADAAGTTQWSLVFIDTFLGQVVETRDATKDTAGHVMHKAEADIAIGFDESADSALQIITVEDDKYSVGQLVLVQTPDASVAAEDNDIVEFPTVTDVPVTDTEFTDDATVLDTDVKVVSGFTVLGTKIATKGNTSGGNADLKTGIEGANNQTYWLSNTYLAGGNGSGDGSVLSDYLTEVTNNLINRTFDLYLDQNGYVVGMQETSTTNVGVVTGVDYNRLGAGRYTVSATVTDVNGADVELELLNHADKNFFENQADAEDYFDDNGLDAIAQEGATAAQDNKKLEKGLLIEWSNVTRNGKQYQVITKIGTDYLDAGKDTVDGGAANDRPIIRTGVTDTLCDTDNSATDLIDDSTRFLIANYKVDYSAASDSNDGNMMLDGYKPYTGFKNIPTINSISTTDGEYVQWSKITSKGQEYFAISAEDAAKGYTMVEQKKFSVDDSYLMLGSGTTYQFHSTYVALKNGEKIDISVSNLNTGVNTDIQKYMVGSTAVELITFEGKDAAGNVNEVAQSADIGHFNTQPSKTAVTADGNYPAYRNGVLTVAANTYLTVATECQVVIVNAAHGTTTPGTLNSINQYAKNTDGTNYFCYELDANGYVSFLYIVD